MTDLDLVSSLRGLLVVERETANQIPGMWPFSEYVHGRIAAYNFAIDAIDARWPDLPDRFDTMEET